MSGGCDNVKSLKAACERIHVIMRDEEASVDINWHKFNWKYRDEAYCKYFALSISCKLDQ